MLHRQHNQKQLLVTCKASSPTFVSEHLHQTHTLVHERLLYQEHRYHHQRFAQGQLLAKEKKARQSSFQAQNAVNQVAVSKKTMFKDQDQSQEESPPEKDPIFHHCA